jgi:hypothetical protein
MVGFCRVIWCALAELFRSRASLQAEILLLRHRLSLRRGSPKRAALSNFDRLIFAALYSMASKALSALTIVKPETVIRWHRRGFRLYWRWKSKSVGGRPKLSTDIRQLISAISLANPLWGAPRIHGELLKLGIDVGQTSVQIYGKEQKTPVARMGNVSPQSCRRDSVDRLVCCPDHLVSTAVWVAHSQTRPP